jgi:hypothetical protein
MQYAMTGAALSVFYLVLLAVSEHLDFAGSYSLAACAMTGLLAVNRESIGGRRTLPTIPEVGHRCECARTRGTLRAYMIKAVTRC